MEYLEKVIYRRRVASWKLSSETILQNCQLAGYPLSGPALVKIFLSVYRETYKPAAKMVIYKACPFMPWHIPESIKFFSEVKFLHLLRDPRAVLHSQLTSIDPFTQKPYSNSALKTALDWKKAAELTEIDSNILEVRFENLLDKPDQTVQGIFQFLELEDASKSDSGEAFINRMEQVDQELHQEITLAPNPEKNMAWQENLSSRDILLTETFLNTLMGEKGYPLVLMKNSNPIFIKILISGGICKQMGVKILRRTQRVFRLLLSSPMYLIRKIKLKIFHG